MIQPDNLKENRMANKSILEHMLEHLVNENREQADELFHDYVVAKSREIYEGLLSESYNEDWYQEADFGKAANDDDFGGDATDNLAGEIDAASDDDDEYGDDEFGGEESEAETWHDLESIVDELQAKFDKLKDLVGVDAANDDNYNDDNDGEEGDEIGFGDDNDDEEVNDSFEPELSTVREYVEQVGTNWGKSPKMGDDGANAKSIVAGKNDMGGTTANILGGDVAKGEGTQGGLLNPKPQDINSGNINVPGGKAGNAFSKKEPGHGAEKKATGDNGVNTQSLFRGKR